MLRQLAVATALSAVFACGSSAPTGFGETTPGTDAGADVVHPEAGQFGQGGEGGSFGGRDRPSAVRATARAPA